MQNTIKKKKSKFTSICNTFINDPNLSLKARGLFLFMYSKPNDWNFTVRSMAKQFKDGVDSIRTALIELKEHGYVGYTKNQDGTGNYFLDDDPNTEIPNTENPNMGKPERISNTDKSSNTDREKSKPKIDFNKLLLFLNEKTGRNFKVINKTVKQKYNARLKEGYTKEVIQNAIISACRVKSHIENGYQYLTIEFFSRPSTLDKYGYNINEVKSETSQIESNKKYSIQVTE